jgi:hypothetical protein
LILFRAFPEKKVRESLQYSTVLVKQWHKFERSEYRKVLNATHYIETLADYLVRFFEISIYESIPSYNFQPFLTYLLTVKPVINIEEGEIGGIGVGEEPDHPTARKSGPLHIVQ